MELQIESMTIEQCRAYKEQIDARINNHDTLMSHTEPFDIERIKSGAEAILIEQGREPTVLRYLTELNNGETIVFVLTYKDWEQPITIKKDGTTYNNFGLSKDQVYIYNR